MVKLRNKFRKVLQSLGLRRAEAPFELRERFPQYEIGEGSYGLLEVHSFSEHDRLIIGKYCSIAKNVRVLLGGEHRTDWVTTYPFPETSSEHVEISGHPKSKGPVVIGNDVWIGMSAIVLSGVRIGDGAVVSAGAVVAKDVEPYAIVAGNPARMLRHRFLPSQVESLLKIKWWEWSADKVNQEIPYLCASDIDAFISRHLDAQDV